MAAFPRAVPPTAAPERMNLDVDGLRAFVKVAELGSFHQAAEALHISQSALSRRISRLEGYLSIRLLDRSTRRVNLTTIGRSFLPQAQRLIDELEASFDSLRKIADHGIGQVVLACVPTAALGILPPVVADYSARYPNNRIRILDRTAPQVAQSVMSGEAEFGITAAGNESPDAAYEPLIEDYFVVACHRDHPLARQKTVKWAQLARHRLIAIGRGGSRSILDLGLPGKILQQSWSYEVQHSYTTGIGLALAGVGVLVVPALALVPGSHPALVFRPLTDPVVSRDIVVMRRRGSTLSPAAAEFLSVLEKRWRDAGPRPRRGGVSLLRTPRAG